jgi:hypothetical protein
MEHAWDFLDSLLKTRPEKRMPPLRQSLRCHQCLEDFDRRYNQDLRSPEMDRADRQRKIVTYM